VTTYVCLLRGINLGARNKVKMADLEALFVALGHADVATYIQSGNVVFTSPVDSPSTLARGIEERIAADLGLEVTVLLRTTDELSRVIEANPFVGGGADPAELHVTFLADEPDPAAAGAVDGGGFEPDEFRILGREVHLRCPDGYGRSKLNNAFWERRLGVAATTRNWRTVNKLHELAGG
jgi:uncharacterized protein (DUF1697 family)